MVYQCLSFSALKLPDMGMCFYQLQSTNGYYVYFMHTFHGMYVTKHMISVCPIGVWRLIGRWEETIGFFSTLQTNPYCRSCFFFLSWWPRRYLMMFDDMGITWFFPTFASSKTAECFAAKGVLTTGRALIFRLHSAKGITYDHNENDTTSFPHSQMSGSKTFSFLRRVA